MSRYVICNNLNGARLMICYPNKTTGFVAADFSDAETLRELNHTLPSYLNLPPSGGKFRMNCPDGESHEFGLYYDSRSRRYLINTFGKTGLFGRDAPYSCDLIGIRLAEQGLEQNEENVFRLLGVSREDKEKDRGNNAFKALRKIAPTPEKAIKDYAETKRESERLNRMEVETCIRKGQMLFAEKEESGNINIPDEISSALSLRGIKAETLPWNTLKTIGFSKGIRPYASSGRQLREELKGTVFTLDDMGGGISWQMRLMLMDKKDGIVSYRYISKEDTVRNRYLKRFYTICPAMPYGLNAALDDEKRRPIAITEGPFDKLSIDAVSDGRLNAVSLQGSGNQRYFEQHAEELKEKGIPVIIAFDEDPAGRNGRTGLMKSLDDAGVTVIGWPGCLGYGDMNDLLRSNSASAHSLINAVTLASRLAQKEALSPATVKSAILKLTGTCDESVLMTGTQTVYANMLLDAVRGFCDKNGASAIKDANKIIASVFSSENAIKLAKKEPKVLA